MGHRASQVELAKAAFVGQAHQDQVGAPFLSLANDGRPCVARLDKLGFDGDVGFACDLLPLYVMAVSYEASLYGNEVSDEEMAAFVAEMRAYFASLPVDRFPNVVALAGALTAGEPDERFEFGLEVLVRGLAAMPR